jgi:hypothetical protein
VKSPSWFSQAVARYGAEALANQITKEDAVREITATTRKLHSEHIGEVYIDHVTRELRAWMTRRAVADAAREHDQLELFPGAPMVFELSPGRFAATAVMTRRDWDAALKQADTKARNADGHRDKVQRAHDLIVPLLTSDDLTTADVWPPIAQLQLAATP